MSFDTEHDPLDECLCEPAKMRTQLEALQRENAALSRELESARLNEARYLFLRDHWNEPEVLAMHPWDDFSPDPDQLDEQIDAAIDSAKGASRE